MIIKCKGIFFGVRMNPNKLLGGTRSPVVPMPLDPSNHSSRRGGGVCITS